MRMRPYSLFKVNGLIADGPAISRPCSQASDTMPQKSTRSNREPGIGSGSLQVALKTISKTAS